MKENTRCFVWCIFCDNISAELLTAVAHERRVHLTNVASTWARNWFSIYWKLPFELFQSDCTLARFHWTAFDLRYNRCQTDQLLHKCQTEKHWINEIGNLLLNCCSWLITETRCFFGAEKTCVFNSRYHLLFIQWNWPRSKLNPFYVFECGPNSFIWTQIQWNNFEH